MDQQSLARPPNQRAQWSMSPLTRLGPPSSISTLRSWTPRRWVPLSSPPEAPTSSTQSSASTTQMEPCGRSGSTRSAMWSTPSATRCSQLSPLTKWPASRVRSSWAPWQTTTLHLCSGPPTSQTMLMQASSTTRSTRSLISSQRWRQWWHLKSDT